MKKWITIIGIVLAVNVILFVNMMSARGKKLASISNGSQAPDFTLVDTNGTKRSLSDYQGQYVVLEWINHGCPYVKKHYNSGNMQSLQKTLTGKKVAWLSICSSAKGKQGYMESTKWNDVIKDKEMASSAVLLDPDGEVGRLFGARTTPHMFVLDPEGKVIYQGAIDSISSASKDDVPKAQNYVQLAVMEAMDGKAVTTAQTEPYGCSVKYK